MSRAFGDAVRPRTENLLSVVGEPSIFGVNPCKFPPHVKPMEAFLNVQRLRGAVNRSLKTIQNSRQMSSGFVPYRPSRQ